MFIIYIACVLIDCAWLFIAMFFGRVDCPECNHYCCEEL
jgi:hypothetical protein